MRRSFSEQITQRTRREIVFTKIKFTCQSYSFLANSKHHTRAAVRESNPRLSALSLKDSYAKRYVMEKHHWTDSRCEWVLLGLYLLFRCNSAPCLWPWKVLNKYEIEDEWMKPKCLILKVKSSVNIHENKNKLYFCDKLGRPWWLVRLFCCLLFHHYINSCLTFNLSETQTPGAARLINDLQPTAAFFLCIF